MPEQQREQAVERLLRRSLASERTVAHGPCVDAEELSAFAEGALRREAASRIEQHLADCGRCQAVLAAFVRTAPEPVALPLWRRWRLPVLVPLATAATAAAIWVATPADPTRPATPAPDVELAARLELPAAPAPPPAEPADAQAPPMAPGAVDEARTEALLQDATSGRGAQRAPTDARERSAGPLGTARVAPEAGSPDQPPSEGRFDARSAEALMAEALAKEEAAPRRAAAAPASVAAPAAVPSAAALASVAASRAAVPVLIQSPDATSRWRIASGGRQVQWSTSGGAEWDTVVQNLPAALTAGAAPAASICWLVGQAGAVYLTTDGARFARVAFPEAVDLVAVTASDERSATVTAADGRSWRTSDQGQTWTR